VNRLRQSPAALLAAILAVLCALAVAACGSAEQSASDKSVDQLLTETFGPNKSVKSGKLDANINVKVKGLNGLAGPIALKLTGPFQSAGKGHLPKFDLALQLGAAGQSFSAGAISTSDKGYLKIQGQAYEVPANLVKQFAKAYEQAQKDGSKSGGGTTLKSLGVDPRGWLKDARKAGETDVAGTKTVHIAAKVDVSRFLQDVNKLLAKADKLGFAGSVPAAPSTLSAKQRRDIERSVKSATIDVYTGAKDTILRRIALRIKLAVPLDVRRSVGGLSSGDVAFDLTLASLNEDQTIEAPTDVKPFSDLSSVLGGLFGLSGSSGSGSTTTPAPSSANSQKYLDCLRAAGQEISKVQKCASLLTP
jgi:hypothetical protein